MSASSSEVFAVLGRIHVLLRRDLNRITDIEWAGANKAYALEVVRLCGTGSHPDLAALAVRLSDLLELAPKAAGGASTRMPAPMGPQTQAALEEVTAARVPAGPRYLGSLR